MITTWVIIPLRRPASASVFLSFTFFSSRGGEEPTCSEKLLKGFADSVATNCRNCATVLASLAWTCMLPSVLRSLISSVVRGEPLMGGPAQHLGRSLKGTKAGEGPGARERDGGGYGGSAWSGARVYAYVPGSVALLLLLHGQFPRSMSLIQLRG